MDIIAPQTKELWEKSCCIEQSWYRTAEEMKRHASSLEEENRKLRELFPQILTALGNGSGCTPDVSLEFLQGIPKEVALVVRILQGELSSAENERIDIAKELESEKKMHAETQNKLDEMTAYADKLAQGLPCLPKDVEVLREANARFAQENHDLLEQMFHTAVGLLSTYGKFATLQPEDVLSYVETVIKRNLYCNKKK